jgi:hypothetical protein
MMILEMEQNDDSNNYMFLLSLSQATSGSSCTSSQCSTITSLHEEDQIPSSKEENIIVKQKEQERDDDSSVPSSLSSILNTTRPSSSPLSKKNNSENRTVTFGTVKVMLFVQQIGDNPSVSSGCPIALGQHIHKKLTTYQVDTYEKLNPPQLRRTKKQLRMSSEERAQILLRLGYSRHDIVQTAKDTYMMNVSKRRTHRQTQLDVYYDSILATNRRMIGVVGRESAKSTNETAASTIKVHTI